MLRVIGNKLSVCSKEMRQPKYWEDVWNGQKLSPLHLLKDNYVGKVVSETRHSSWKSKASVLIPSVPGLLSKVQPKEKDLGALTEVIGCHSE